MKSKVLSCLAVAAVAAVMGQGAYAVEQVPPIDMGAVRMYVADPIDNGGIDAQDESGNTALNRAVRAHNLGEVNRLLDAGADWSITNLYDDAPLHSAVMLNEEEIVASLLAHGADVNQRTRNGEIPLDVLSSYMDPVENARALRIRAALLAAGSEFRPIPTAVVPASLDDIVTPEFSDDDMD